MTSPSSAREGVRQHPGRDRHDLGRGALLARLPVLWQAGPPPADAPPFKVREEDTARGFTLRTALSSPRATTLAAFFAVLYQACAALLPVLMGLAIDRALQDGSAQQLVFWLCALGVNFLVMSGSERFSTQLTAWATEQVQHQLRSTLSRSVLHPDQRHVDNNNGEILSTLTNDLFRLSAVVGLVVYPVGEIAGIAIIAIALFTIHPWLGVAVLVGAPLVVWSMGAMRGPFTRRTSDYQGLLAASVGRAADLVTGYRVIKGVGADEEAAERYRVSSQKALSGALSTINALGFYLTGSNAVSRVFVALVAGLAGVFAVRDEITIGQLIAVVGLTQALLTPITMLTANAGAVWAGAVASGGRVLDLLLTTRHAQAGPAHRVDGAPQDAPLVAVSHRDGGSVEVAPGSLVGVRVDDAAAAGLVAAFMSPRDTGEWAVEVDGAAAARLEPVDYRTRVVVAPHEATIFSGTLGENLGIPSVATARVLDALRAARCHDFAGDEDDLGRDVGENGNRLSGGQRQRVGLARAYALDPPFLLLHEPTTAVDSVTEAAIARDLPDLRRGRSTLLITTSPTLLAHCDRVIDLTPAGDLSEVSR